MSDRFDEPDEGFDEDDETDEDEYFGDEEDDYFEADEPDYYDELSVQYHAEQDELNAEDTFFNTYGFKHECHCANDWDEGNVGVVSVCFLNMCTEAMDALKERIQEVRQLRAQNAQFRVALVEQGTNPDEA